MAGFAYPLSSLSLSIVEARGNSKNFFKVEVIKKILFLPIYFIAYFYGITYFLISFVVAAFIATFINVRFVKFEIDISVFTTVKLLCRYFFSTLLLVVVGELAHYYFQTIQHFIISGIEAIVFILLYVGLHSQFKSNGYQYTLALLKH